MLLDTQPDLEVVGEASSGEHAVALTAQTAPDVVVMDLSMPGAGGLPAIAAISASHPQSRILALTMLDDPGTVRAAMRAGARGYLVKGAAGDEALHAIRAVAHGAVIFAPDVADDVLQRLDHGPATGEPFPDLTDRERDVLRLLADGQGNALIARQLHLSDKTVRNYISNIFRKLHVTSRVDAALRAREAGL